MRRGTTRSFIVSSLVAIAPAAAHGQAQAQATAHYVTISGRVIDDDKTPVPSAELGLKLMGYALNTARSGNDGHFEFSKVPLTTGSITVRRLGYRSQTLTLDLQKVAAGEPFVFTLETVATEVDPVTVESSGGRMTEFYDHKAQSNFGHFFERADIQRINPRVVTELFRTVPGAMLTPGPGTGNKLLLRGCRPRVWVNGVRTENAEVDEVVTPAEVEGIEVYPSWAGTPPQYMDRENRACGTVVVWTRR